MELRAINFSVAEGVFIAPFAGFSGLIKHLKSVSYSIAHRASSFASVCAGNFIIEVFLHAL